MNFNMSRNLRFRFLTELTDKVFGISLVNEKQVETFTQEG